MIYNLGVNELPNLTRDISERERTQCSAELCQLCQGAYSLVTPPCWQGGPHNVCHTSPLESHLKTARTTINEKGINAWQMNWSMSKHPAAVTHKNANTILARKQMKLCRSDLPAVTSQRFATCGTSLESGEKYKSKCKWRWPTFYNFDNNQPIRWDWFWLQFHDLQIHANLSRVSRNLPLDGEDRNSQQFGGQPMKQHHQHSCDLSTCSTLRKSRFHLVSQESIAIAFTQ